MPDYVEKFPCDNAGQVSDLESRNPQVRVRIMHLFYICHYSAFLAGGAGPKKIPAVKHNLMLPNLLATQAEIAENETFDLNPHGWLP